MSQRASSSSPFISRYSYDVFLSFRGEDTRFGFTGHLYSDLSQRGIFTFIDDEVLQKGHEITPSLCKAIQESRMSIIIFSKNYASSTFCLDELVQILECYTKQNMWILPVFYDVDPSHVRHQKGSYKEALAKHEHGRFKDNIEKVLKWRLALHQAANLSGLHIKIGEEYEFEFIKKISEEVSNKLNRPPLHIADYPVGLQARIQQIEWLRGAQFDSKVTMFGIHGMGGIGKSTLARAIYNLISDQFEASCFIANIREKSSTRHGLVKIQETMLSELVGERNINLGDVCRGIPLLQQRLSLKKVLLVLDDIDKNEQLQATAGGLDWFGPGSIIIITTRDRHLLDIHRVEKQYEVNELDGTESLELFSWTAFQNKEVDPNYMEIINRAIDYANGLPLALKIIGSNLLGKSLDEWESALEAYERIPNRDIQDILRVSYDSLDANVKEIFLDIACFFRGRKVRYVINMLEARGFHPKFGMTVLEKKSLIKICCHQEIVGMHDLIQYMGKEIVRQQSFWPQKRNRLFYYEDIVRILEINTENYKIEAIMLDMPEDQEMQWNLKVFEKMKNLQMMLIENNGGFSIGPIGLPNSLRVLEWWGYPAASLPSNFNSRNLVRLDLSYSNFRWDKDKPLEHSKVLRHLIIRGCKNIRQIPDLSGFPNLTELCIAESTKLIEIHDSVGSLHNLQWFCAEGCTKLMIGPRGIKLTSLEHLCLRDCSSLVMFPEILAPMHKLRFVNLEGTAINNLPLSMQNLEGLQSLSLKRCEIFNEPSNFFQMLQVFFPNLKKLFLQDSNLTILPACIEECLSLTSIDVSNCKRLQEIKGLPPNMIGFVAENTPVGANTLTLNMLLRRAIDSSTIRASILPGQWIPEWFDHLCGGNTIRFWFRNEFPSLIMCAVSGVWDASFVKVYFHIRINHVYLCKFRYVLAYKTCTLEDDHLFIFNFKKPFPLSMDSDIEKVPKMNEWNSGEVSVVMKKIASPEDSHSWGVIKRTGVYVNRAFSRMDDVRFTDPNLPNNTSDVGNQLVLLREAPHIQQQNQSLPLFNPTMPLGSEIWEQPLNYVYNQDETFLDNQEMVPSFDETNNVEEKGEMGSLMSEVSMEVTHQSKDFVEANMKIESTASESHKVDEVEVGWENKKNRDMTLENKLNQRLTRIKKMNEDLGEKLRAIKANISAIEANRTSIKENIFPLKLLTLLLKQKGT